MPKRHLILTSWTTFNIKNYKMETLDLSACITNQEVCDIVSERVNSIPYTELLSEMEKRFIYQTEAIKAIYTGLSMNMNVFLSGPGGYGKSTLIKHILNFYGIPFTVVVGYKDMPVDALLGIPNMDMLLKESKYEINFKESVFYNPGVLIGEEFTDILPSTAAALKDILTERGLHTKSGKVESLVCCMILAANKSAKEVIDDESKRAFYKERFPLQVEVTWYSHTAKDYFRLFTLNFPEAETALLFFMSKLLEDNHINFNNTISPRIACEITKVYLKKGINFIGSFPIDTRNLSELKTAADREFNTKSVAKLMKEVIFMIYSIKTAKEHKMAALYALRKIESLKLDDEILNVVMDAKKTIEDQLAAKPYNDSLSEAMDNIFKLVAND